MTFRAGTNWCHDFPKVARDSGFHFNMHRARVRVDWKRIGSIDIDRVISERDFSTIDDNVNNIVDCCLESEYDLKILDPNFVKLFRLAQLAVEYLLYCKQYLDRSVVILKDELRSKLEENVRLRKELDVHEAKFKERTRFSERKLNDSHGEIHKCPHCPKTFVSATFVSAHVDRRHPHSRHQSSSDNSPAHKRYLAEAEKLHEEIKTLKERLNQTERVIRNKSEKDTDDGEDAEKGSGEGRLSERRKARDRDEERYRGYEEEIRHFKATLLSEIRNLKLSEATTHREKEDADEWSGEDFKELVRRQEKEIRRLRDQLQKRLTPDIEGIHAKLENQEDFWQSKIDSLEARHRVDMEKLYSQLKVSRESVNEMRIDCMSKINDLEWRSRSESALLPEARDNNPQNERFLSAGDSNGPREARRLSTGSSRLNCTARESKPHDERVRDQPTGRPENISGVEDNSRRKDIAKSALVVSLKQPDVHKAAVSPTRKQKRPSRSDEPKSNIAVASLLRESHESPLDRYQLSSLDKPTTDRAFDEQDVSSLDSCTTTTTSTAGKKHAAPIGEPSSEEARKLALVPNKRRFFVSDAPRKNRPNRLPESGMYGEKFDESDLEVSEVSEEEDEEENSDARAESKSDDTIGNAEICNRQSKIEDDFPAKTESGPVSAEEQFESKLRDLGIDPEWRSLPNGSFAQIMETISHNRRLNCKKYQKYEEIRNRIIQRVARTLLAEGRVAKTEISPRRTPLEKLVTNVRSKATRALRILEKNDGSRRGVNRGSQRRKDHRSGLTVSTKIEKPPRALRRISQETSREFQRPRPSSRKLLGDDNAPNDLKHSYESIKDFVRDTNRKLVTSTPRGNERKSVLENLSPSFVNDASAMRNASNPGSLSGSPRNNGKGVLKSTSATSASLVKKKVLFDLEDGTSPEGEEEDEDEDEDEEALEENEDFEEEDEEEKQDEGQMESGWNSRAKKDLRSSLFDIPRYRRDTGPALANDPKLHGNIFESIYDSRDSADREIGVSPQSGSIVLKTRQSEKIALISKQIEKQLSVPREKPVGAVEAIFMDKFSLRDNEESREVKEKKNRAENDAPARRPENETGTDKNIPRAAPRLSHYRTSDIRDSNLEMDIDELLEIQ